MVLAHTASNYLEYRPGERLRLSKKSAPTTPTVSDDESWMRMGSCNFVDPDLWYPEDGAQTRENTAKRICHKCPVRRECLEFAITHHERWGIWGGLTNRERDKLQKRDWVPGSEMPYVFLRRFGLTRVAIPNSNKVFKEAMFIFRFPPGL